MPGIFRRAIEEAACPRRVSDALELARARARFFQEAVASWCPSGRSSVGTLLRNSTEGYVRRTLRRMTQRVYREYPRQRAGPRPLRRRRRDGAVPLGDTVDSTTLRFGATHPWGATPGVAAEARRGCAPVSSHGEWHFHQWRGDTPPRLLFAATSARAPVQRRRLFDRRRSVGGARRRARRAVCGASTSRRTRPSSTGRPRRRGRARGAGRAFRSHVAGAGRRADAAVSAAGGSRPAAAARVFVKWRGCGVPHAVAATPSRRGPPRRRGRPARCDVAGSRGAGNATAAALRAAFPRRRPRPSRGASC